MVNQLQKNPDLLKLGGERREMTFLFMDICGFTTISEHYKKICSLVNGDVSAEVISTDLDGIISEGEKLSQLDKKL